MSLIFLIAFVTFGVKSFKLFSRAWNGVKKSILKDLYNYHLSDYSRLNKFLKILYKIIFKCPSILNKSLIGFTYILMALLIPLIMVFKLFNMTLINIDFNGVYINSTYFRNFIIRIIRLRNLIETSIKLNLLGLTFMFIFSLPLISFCFVQIYHLCKIYEIKKYRRKKNK